MSWLYVALLFTPGSMNIRSISKAGHTHEQQLTESHTVHSRRFAR